MIMRRFERRQARDTLPDALLALAASLQDASDGDDALNRLTRTLAERGISCAFLVQLPDGQGLRLERATLPLAPEVWGRTLRLPRLAAALTRGRPLIHGDVDEAFTEAGADGSRRRLLTDAVAGKVIVAPMRVAAQGKAVLCLASRELEERDRAAAWGLALQLGAALREAASGRASSQTLPAGAAGEELSLFHELTRRLSYSLTGDEIVRTSLEVLAPPLGFHLAAAVICRGGKDVTTIYAPQDAPPGLTSSTAASALDAFLRLTGEKHRSCAHPPFETVTLAIGAPAGAVNGPGSSRLTELDAPLVTESEVTGLLRVAAAQPNAFDAAKERTFYTVANQVSLALERVAAQREAARTHIASLAESLSDGIVLVDAGLRVTSLNSAARTHVAALTAARLVEGATLASTPLAALAQEALASGRPTSLRDLPANPASSERRYLVAMAAPLAGSPEGSAAVVILRDVTEERLMQERLLQSEKMVSVGQLVSGVAHELNNPLTGIMGFAQLLLARELDERTQRDVETIHTEAERASKIVQNLLSFARRKRAEKEMANVNTLLERVLELRSYDLRVKNIEVVLDLDPNLPETMVDADQIQQVFLNVIINAEQAMLAAAGRGTLTVRSRRDGDTLRLGLQDDGPGMEPQLVRRIFDPFFTTKDTGEGTGLGLTISYSIIDEHGGRIWAESQPGRGTTFFLELPIVQGRERPAAPPEEEPAPEVTRRSILVVDDEESIQRLLGSILQMDGHQVDTARNGLEALEYISRRRYDVVITDIKMPDMDGRDLYRRLLELDRGLADRTVFITGDTVSPETRSFLENVRNPCLAKPFRVRDVRETILQVLPNGT